VSPENDGKSYTLTTSVQNLIAYWNQGGLIEVEGFFPNPETGSSFTDLAITGSYADIYTDNGNAKNVAYKASLNTFVPQAWTAALPDTRAIASASGCAKRSKRSSVR
jgi:hypothetical protein